MSEKDELVNPFRLAFRVEGRMIHCYFAAPDNMIDPVLMGSILKSFCDGDPVVWEEFKALMRRAVNVMLKDVIGSEASDFVETPAAEHEKSGNA